MPSSTIENYLKHIFIATQTLNGDTVPMGTVARDLSVSPGTATSMVKTLARNGLVSYEPRHGVQLSPEGRDLALQILRRHRLIEFFLAETLQMDWSEVHAEAERLEHAVSDRLLEHLDRFLGHPKFDPHGDAIPSAKGVMVERDLVPMAALDTGESGRVARISDADGDFLRYAREHSLVPGARFRARNKDTIAACLSVELTDGRALTLGLAAAERIFVERIPTC